MKPNLFITVCADRQIVDLPEEVWQRIAGNMTATEWASSGALCCKRLQRLQLPFLNMRLPNRGWEYYDNQTEMNSTDVPGGLLLSSVQWACTHWQAANKLCFSLVARLRRADAEAAEALLTDEAVPKLVRKLNLRDNSRYSAFFMHAEVCSTLVECGLFPWLVSSLGCVEVMLLAMVYPLPPLSHLTALKHLTLVGYDGYDLCDLVHLSSLESLEFKGTPRVDSGEDITSDTGMDLDLLLRLKWLRLTHYLPADLTLPPGCRVSLSLDVSTFKDSDSRVNFDNVWQNIGAQVYSLTCENNDDEERGGVEDCRFLEIFPNLEQLAFETEGDVIDDWDFGPIGPTVQIDFRSCPRLQHLTRLKVSFVAPDPNSTIDVTVPGHLRLQTLIVMVHRLHLKLESPQQTGSTLEEMIVGSTEPSVQFRGADLFELMDALMSRGIAIGTAVDGAQAYSSRKMCLYTKVAGTPPKSYEELVKVTKSCSCGACWSCAHS